jgi:integrase
MARLLNDAHKGTLIDPSKMTLGAYLRSWLDGKTDITGVTVERYTSASALIKAGIDVVSVSRRLGHSSPVITLKIYAHLFGDGADTDAAMAIERMMR